MTTADDTAKEVARFQAYLRQRGLKLTAQRTVIARKVLGTNRHFSAEELVSLIRRERRRTSRATVYRTLALMEASGLVSSTDVASGLRFYEQTRQVAPEHREHLRCLECEKVVPFRSPDVERLRERIARGLGFEVVAHTLDIFGVCAECRTTRGATTA